MLHIELISCPFCNAEWIDSSLEKGICATCQKESDANFRAWDVIKAVDDILSYPNEITSVHKLWLQEAQEKLSSLLLKLG